MGGSSGPYSPLSEVWQWDGAAWTSLGSSAVGPTGDGAVAVAVASQGQIVVNDSACGVTGTLDWTTVTEFSDGSTWSWWNANNGPGAPLSDTCDPAAMVVLGNQLVLVDTMGSTFTATPSSQWIIPGGGGGQGNPWHSVVTGSVGSRGAVAGAVHGQVVLFGGAADSFFSPQPPFYLDFSGGTWTFDGKAWTQLTVTGPSARGYASAAVLGDELVLFGGEGASGYLGDTWTWDGSAWTQHDVPGPSPRSRATAATFGGRVVLYGGGDASGPLGDTWTWDGSAWTQHAVPGPSPRWGAVLVNPTGF